MIRKEGDPSARYLLPGLKQLPLRELHKRAGLGDKFLVGPHLHDLAADQHDDPVRMPHVLSRCAMTTRVTLSCRAS